MNLRWLPNAISVMRIVLVAPVVWLIVDGAYAFALMLFFVAGVSDALDGFLAKTFGWHSRIGALLDPLADKLLLVASFVALWFTGWMPAWIVVVVVLRDVIIIGGAAAYHYLIKPVEGDPTKISKLNTALELLLVLSVLSQAAYGWPPESAIIAIGASVIVTVVISGIDYVWTWSAKARVRQ